MLRLTIFTKAERCKGVDKATRVEKLLKATFFISPPSLEFYNEAIMHYLRGNNIRVERSFGIWTALLICLTGWRLGDVLVKITFFSSTLLIPLHIPASASNSKSRSMQRCWQRDISYKSLFPGLQTKRASPESPLRVDQTFCSELKRFLSQQCCLPIIIFCW